MPVERRFLIAPSFVRLLQREIQNSERIVEGHFPSQQDHARLIRIEREQAALILTRQGQDGAMVEEPAVIPHSQAEALMDVAAGTVAFDQMIVPVGGNRVAILDHFLMPNGLDVLTMPVDDLSDPPAWFGPEITHRTGYDTNSLALNGRPTFREVEITNRALEALLDALEGRSSSSTPSGQPAPSEPELTTAMKPGSAMSASAPPGEEPARVARREPSAEPLPRRVADRSDITPKHLRRLEREARRTIFRESADEPDDGIARIARAFAPDPRPH